MRTLSRPMFKMGGPIKEGVMHGIREPYRGGGVALVGNPVYPKTNGREHHAETPYSKGWNRIYGNTTRTPLNITGISEVRPTGGSTTATTGRIASAIDKAKKAQGFFQNPKFSEKGLYELGKKYIPKLAKGIWGSAKWGLGRFPGISTLVGGEYVTRPKAWEKEMGISRWDKLKRDLTPWYGTQDKIKQYQDWKKQQADKLIDQITIKDDKSVEKVLTDAEKKLIEDAKLKNAKAAKDKRVNELLEIMGYDKSKNDAVSKALIDASQIIGERGTLSKKNITRELINPIIAATGKRLEKPEQIREAVGLMMAKGEIEKQMNPLKNEALRLQIEGYKKQLAGTNFKEAVLAASKDGQPSGAKLAGLARQYLPGDFKVMQLKVPDKTDTLEFIIDEVKKSHTNPDIDPFPAGQYVLKERVIKIDEQGNVTPLDL